MRDGKQSKDQYHKSKYSNKALNYSRQSQTEQ